MINALLGILLVTPLFGLLGTMVVNNRMAFFSDALGHSALTGIALGVIVGIHQPLWSMICFSVLMTVLIIIVKKANTASTDTIIGVFSSTAVALGIAILSSRGGFNKYSVYLIGDLLSINSTDLLLLAIVFIIIVVLWFLVFNKLLLVSVNHSLARSRGINVQVYEYIFSLVVALIVTISIQWVGIMLISSMMVLPAAAARNISKNTRQYHLYSVSIAVISGLAGLIFSYFLDTATGATIVVISSIFFAVTFLIKLKFS
ncbi:MAG: metal ABC transporter permease [Bacillota bacterium]|nr:metal ABC transporter permease [Bacillota bacterium]